MAKKPATHYGECQVCGHTQKLPNGKMALHGYTKRWHFFSGVCQGSKHLPFEQSMDMIPPRIADSKEMAKNLRARAKEKRAEKDFNVERSFTYRDVGMTSWQWESRFRGTQQRDVSGTLISKEMIIRPGEPSEYRYTKVMFQFTFDGKVYEKDSGAYAQSLEEYRDKCKEHEANMILRTAGQYEEYVKWQTARIKDWKVKPLKPVA